MLRPKQLGHLVLRVCDLDACERFYSDILGLHITNKHSGQMVFMSASEAASHELASELHSITDSENRHGEFEDLFFTDRRFMRIYA